jgi:hypothetical protein
MNLYQKLIEVRKEVPYLQKENQGEQYKYVSSSQVLGNVKAKLDELGVLLVPAVKNHNVNISSIEFLNEKGTPTKRTNTYFTEIDMLMTWINAEKPDEKIECTWYGQGIDIAGEKGVGKALTYAEKYFMLKFFNIPTDKDDPDSFQKRMDDDEPQKTPQQLKKSPDDNKTTQQKNKPETDSGASDKATKEQVKAVFAAGRTKKELLPDFDMFKLIDDMAANCRLTTKWTYADKEKTKINWTQADILALMEELELPFK